MEPVFLVVAAVVIVVGVLSWLLFFRPRAGAPAPSVRPEPGRGLDGRLPRSRMALGAALRGVLTRTSLDDGFWEAMEEALIGSDIGVATSASIVERVRRARPVDSRTARDLLAGELTAAFDGPDRRLALDGNPAVILIAGVNGSGKTTTIAKLAARLVAAGRSPLLAAADTFRAAADAQLRSWADRVGVPVVSGRQGSDPASVAFDSLTAAKARGKDVLLVDTAGRLQSKQHLMAELTKIRRVLEREGGQISEALLVLDASGGQNGINQVREFAQAIGLTGIVLTKLDGTSKGGIVVAVERDLGVPVKFVGVGEGIDDLIPFEPGAFVSELMADA
ncbi:MAG TPA: signal recognition particle-docking protein FtsY [Acidimicrobiia bacterium]